MTRPPRPDPPKHRTQNGLWMRMPQIAVGSMIQFQDGGQRFRLRVL